MRGRKPKPEGLRELQGNPGKRAMPKGPKPESVLMAPPDHLPEVAVAEWHRVAPGLAQMGALSACDRAGLAAYCAAYARWVRAEKKIAQFEAELIKTPNGSVQQSPWVSIANRSLELMHKFMVEFGMTPSSRVRLGRGAGDGNSEGDGDALDQFLADDSAPTPLR